MNKHFRRIEPIVVLFPSQVFIVHMLSTQTKNKRSFSFNIAECVSHEWGVVLYYVFSYIRPSDRFRHLRFRCRRGGVVPFIPAALAFIYFKFE